MMLEPSGLFFLGIVTVAFLICLGFIAWRWHGSVVAPLKIECERLQALSEARERWYQEANSRTQAVEGELQSALDNLSKTRVQTEQLRDLIKVHVARRREFDEWANPIKAHLGEGIGHVLHNLKDSLARQEFALRRQERVVSEAQDQYRAKRDELERMRRELTLKNYHIATLNERFIRIEERMQSLTAEFRTKEPSEEIAGRLHAVAPEIAALRDVTAELAAGQSPETETLLADDAKAKDWMGVLGDWHKQLQDRFERLEELQARIRGGSAQAAEAAAPRLDRAGTTG
jgi:chromosome segregation ATPase